MRFDKIKIGKRFIVGDTKYLKTSMEEAEHTVTGDVNKFPSDFEVQTVDAVRQQKARKRKRNGGKVEVRGLFVMPEHVQAVKDFVNGL